MDIYSASLKLLLRSAPYSSTAKRSSFKARVECVRVNPGEQSQCQWKTIPNRGANQQKCMGMYVLRHIQAYIEYLHITQYNVYTHTCKYTYIQHT